MPDPNPDQNWVPPEILARQRQKPGVAPPLPQVQNTPILGFTDAQRAVARESDMQIDGLSPDQSDFFGYLDSVSNDQHDARNKAIAQSYVQKRLPGISIDAIQQNWPAVKAAFSKHLGKDGKPMEDAAFLSAVHNDILDEEAGSLLPGTYRDVWRLRRHQLSDSGKEFWKSLNQPIINIPEIPELPNISALGAANPAVTGAALAIARNVLMGVETPFGLATLGAGAELHALGKAYPAVRMALAGASGVFMGVMGHSTSEAYAEAKRVSANPASTIQDEMIAWGNVATSGLMTLGAAFGVLEEAKPGAISKIGSKHINEIPEVATEMAAQSETVEERAAWMHVGDISKDFAVEGESAPLTEPAREKWEKAVNLSPEEIAAAKPVPENMGAEEFHQKRTRIAEIDEKLKKARGKNRAALLAERLNLGADLGHKESQLLIQKNEAHAGQKPINDIVRQMVEKYGIASDAGAMQGEVKGLKEFGVPGWLIKKKGMGLDRLGQAIAEKMQEEGYPVQDPVRHFQNLGEVTDLIGKAFSEAKKEIPKFDLTEVLNPKEQRREDISTGTGEETDYEKEMMEGWRKQTEAETAPGKASLVSVKDEMIDNELEAMGRPKATRGEKLTQKAAAEYAAQKFEDDPEIGRRLIDSLKNNPRPVKGREIAIALHELNRRARERDVAERQFIEARESKDPAKIADANERVARAQDSFVEAGEVTSLIGTDQAQGLALRQMIMKRDFSIANMQRSMEVAHGRRLTPEELDQLRDLNQDIAGTLEDVEKIARKKGKKHEDAFDKAHKDILERAGEKEEIDPETQRKEILDNLRTKIAEGEGLDSFAGYISKLAEGFVRQGITGREPLIDAVHTVLSDIMPDITRRETMDAISGYGKFSRLNPDAIKAILRGLKGEMQQIGKLLDMAVGRAPKKTGVERRIPNDIERMLIREVNEAKKKGGFQVTDPASQLRSALQTIKTRLKHQIDDMTRQLETRTRDKKTGRTVELDPEAKALKEQRDTIKAQYEEMFGKGGMSPQERYQAFLKGYKTRLERSTAEVERRIAEKDFAPEPKVPPRILDEEAEAAQTKHERAVYRYQEALAKARLENRSRWEKTQDVLVKWRRGFLLTGAGVLEKLTAAGVYRFGLTAVEEAASGALGQLPFVKDMAEMASIEGGMNVRALASGYADAFMTGLKKYAVQKLKTGKTDLDIKYQGWTDAGVGERDVTPASVIDYFGRLHGALKAPVHQFAFRYAMEKQIAWAINHGLDPKDPVFQVKASLRAYKYANRQIFLQDNITIGAYKAALSFLEKPDATGHVPFGKKLGGTAAQLTFPITKVPTNIVGEATEYIFGLGTGSAQLAWYFRKGIESFRDLPDYQDRADTVMRQLKKGLIGSAAMLIAWHGYKSIGGYHQAGEKRKPGEPKAGSIQVGGTDIDQHLLHHPIVEAAQITATARHVMESKLRARDEEDQGLDNGIVAAGFGLLEEVPFMREAVNVAKLFDAKQRQRAKQDLIAGVVVPQGLKEIAQWTDRDSRGPIKRKASTVLEQIEAGVPGLRQRLPRVYE